MVSTIIGWAGFLLALFLTYQLVRVYLVIRGTSTKMAAVASVEFFEASESLLTAGSEVPDSILGFLEKMNSTACSKNGHFELLRLLKSIPNSKRAIDEKSKQFEADLNGLRTELHALFDKAVVSWLNYLTHKNVAVQVMIFFQARRIEDRTGHLEASPEKAGVKYLHQMGSHTC